MGHDDASSTDERFLDDVLDKALVSLEEGRTVDIEILAAARPHLRDAVAAAVKLAEQTAVGRAPVAPTIAGFRIVGELGSGGMGTVYLARQERLGGRQVALKVLPPAAAVSGRSRERFLAEARAIARLRHPNIVAIHDVIDDGRTLAYAMERVEGLSLAERIRRHGPLEPLAACRLGIAVARALGAVHDAGLVHRDVKPSNVLLREDGTPLLSDFGLVRETDTTVTQAGHFAGTAPYSAPEQLRGEVEAIDVRSDVYSLGVTLYHCLTGRLPFPGASPAATLRAIESGLALPLRRADPKLPRDLDTVVATAIALDPAHRYQSAGELADDLERVLQLQPIRARRAALLARATKLLRRNRRVVVAAITGAVAVLSITVAAAIVATWIPGRIREGLAQARRELLNPLHGELIYVEVMGAASGFSRQMNVPSVLESYERALAHYEAVPWVARLHSDWRDVARERQTVALARAVLARGHSLDELNGPLERRAPLTWKTAAAWIDAGGVLPIESGELAADATDLRFLGLLGFLCGDAGLCNRAWSQGRLDLAAEPDPLVDASLGQLYLASGEYGRAFARLERAWRAFPEAGYLAVDLASAAIEVGDFDYARDRLQEAESLALQDPFETLKRVRADFYAAPGNPHGDPAEASRLYEEMRRDHQAPTARLNFARFLERQGKAREAFAVMEGLVQLRPTIRRYHRSFLEMADRWWDAQHEQQRQRLARQTLDTDKQFLRELCTAYVQSREALAAAGVFLQSDPAARPRDPASSLHEVTLEELARRMEVTDMNTWIPKFRWPRWLKAMQARAWLAPDHRSRRRWSLAVGAGAMMVSGAAQGGGPACTGAGTVPSESKISATTGGFQGDLDLGDRYGQSVAEIGDLDGDGVSDIAVGADQDDDGGTNRGAVWVLFLNADGTVKAEQKISSTQGGFPGPLDDGDRFGFGVTALGDLDGDGVGDLAVGAFFDDDGGTDRGAVWILFMDADGTVKAQQKISSTQGGFPGPLDNGDGFGASVAALGDLDGDGVSDLAVGARFDDDGGTGDRGAVWVLFLNTDGTVKFQQKISSSQGGFPGPLDNDDQFGISVAVLGDLDGDGVRDLAVGAELDDDGGTNRGAVWVLFLNTDGTVKAQQKISSTQGGFPGPLDNDDQFGVSVAALGDLDGDGVTELAVGAPLDDDGGTDRGAVWVLFLNTNGTVKAEQKISSTQGLFVGQLDNQDLFGASVGALGDLDGDGLSDLAVGAYLDDDGGTDTGAVWLLELNDCGPAITQQPGGVLLPVGGGIAVFTVVGAGEDPLSYQWLRDNVALTDGPGIAGSATPELTVDAGNDDIGLYTVMISNSFEVVTSRTAVLGIRQSCAGDIDDDDDVDVNDFLDLLQAWGACP